MKKETQGITVKKENLVDWYSEVVQKAELADYAPIKGFMIIRPNAYSIWQNIQDYFNKVLEKKGVRNAYFPLLIPESFFKKEAKHAEGFNPELAYIKNTDEGEKLALRPTSETIMYDSYSKWIRSWRDLPLKINQWCNVIRWEVKQTKPFLRTREFLWQEGHCVFSTENEAEENMNEMAEEYKKMVEEILAIPVLIGKKSEGEKFAGAQTTMTIESLMPDGKALQMGTSHNLGQNFAKAFNVKFKDQNEKEQYGWQTSWGFSTRLIGALTMVHGDDKGLVLPPKIAHNKLVIIPILFDKTSEKVLKKSKEIEKKLAKFNPIADYRTDYSPGWKYHEWEMKGIPLRIEIGPNDLAKKQVVIVRRDTNEKISVPEKNIEKEVPKLLDEIQKNLFNKAKKFLDSRIDKAETLKELKEKIKLGKIVKAYFIDDGKTEDYIKEATEGSTSRLIEFSKTAGICIHTGQKTNTIGYFSKSY
ncbi:MAG: proline--tRNA ligase [Nanoarchaeota archaeon]|nr:proline--tRNA ligase [Nanoarchaeota archaeon]